MNDLLDAAKAVIDNWEHGRSPGVRIQQLRAAVERAEKQEVDFDNWWNQTEIWPSEYTAAASAWIAAQLAERERIKEIVAELLDQEDPWIHYSTLLEKIDAAL